MRRVDVQALVKREGDRIIVQRRVCGRVVRLNRGMRQTRHELLNVANSKRSGNRCTESRVVPGDEYGQFSPRI